MHLISLEGEVHSKLRRVSQKVLANQVQERICLISFRHAIRLREKLILKQAPFSITDIDRILRSVALDIISEAIFGTSWNSLDGIDEQKANALSTIMETLHWRINDLGDRSWRNRPFRPSKVLETYCLQEIRNPMPESMLFEWMKYDLSDDELQNLCMTFLTMGHENISTAMSWLLLQLAQNPDIQNQARKQVIESGIFKSTTPPANLKMKLNSLSVLSDSFLEASRLYPSVAVLSRMNPKETQVCGFTIPAYQQLVVSIYDLNRDSSQWGDDAHIFNPGRKCEAWTFGGGPRSCVGKPLSFIESPIVIASILSEFQVRAEKVLPQNMVSFRPGKHELEFVQSAAKL